MSEPIPPVLTPEQWAELRTSLQVELRDHPTMATVSIDTCAGVYIANEYGDSTDAPAPVVMAIANVALPDDDPRKITREWVESIRVGADIIEGEERGTSDDNYSALRVIAHALESLLPPPDHEGATRR